MVTSAWYEAVFLAVGLAIWYFRQDSNSMLQNTYFVVGGVPIVVFSIIQFGNFFGRGDTTCQLN
jgi:hypothetical protein